MNESFLSKWSWKGFFLRYSIILVGLVAIYYFMSSSDVSNPSQPAHEGQTPTMHVTHELVGRDLHLQFALNHFELSFDNVGKENVQNQGHIHLYLDGEKVMKIYENHYVYKDLPPGKHEIKVELAHNNHESYGIEQTFDVTVAE